jgi:hypothetical protein
MIRKFYDTEYGDSFAGTIEPRKKFEDIVRAMSAKEIIMAMVDSLTPPPLIPIEMGSYGGVKIGTKFIEKSIIFGLFKIKVEKPEITCFGCAATNTICKISGIIFNDSNIYNGERRAKALNASYTFLTNFEYAIDSLRKGNLNRYNQFASYGEFAKIQYFQLKLVKLENHYTLKHLENYKKLADFQDIVKIDPDIITDKKY